MNAHTPSLMKFVLYSTNELAAGDGAGFWSNDVGWVEYRFATRFTLDSVPSCTLPVADARDAKWMVWQDARAPVDSLAA